MPPMVSSSAVCEILANVIYTNRPVMTTIHSSAAQHSGRDTCFRFSVSRRSMRRDFPHNTAETTIPYVTYIAKVQMAMITTSTRAQTVKMAVIGITTQMAFAGTL